MSLQVPHVILHRGSFLKQKAVITRKNNHSQLPQVNLFFRVGVKPDLILFDILDPKEDQDLRRMCLLDVLHQPLFSLLRFSTDRTSDATNVRVVGEHVLAHCCFVRPENL